MFTSDRRLYGRVPVEFPVTQYIGTARVRGQAVDIGYGGMRIRSGSGVRSAGERYTVAFNLPGKDQRLECGVEVMYQRNGVEGLRFTTLHPADQVQLYRYVSVHLAGKWFAH